jgi:hypothetical protein
MHRRLAAELAEALEALVEVGLLLAEVQSELRRLDQGAPPPRHLITQLSHARRNRTARFDLTPIAPHANIALLDGD